MDADAAKLKLKKLNSVLDKIRKDDMRGKH